MRDRLWKGKRIDNGEWVIGNLIYSEDAEEGWEAIIIPTFDSNMFTKNGAKGNLGFENWYRVDKDTICQYTGSTNKNRNKIWENDVVWVDGTDRAIVIFSEKHSGYILQPIGDFYFDSPMLADNVDIIDNCIGNIFDNPEFLKGGASNE